MRPPLLPGLLVAALLAAPAWGEVVMTEGPDKVSVSVGGAPFTEYHFTGATHVYCYPLLGPGGAKMTREWPMGPGEGEEHDHPHHRSLWFAHSAVNGTDFWTELASFGSKPPRNPLGQIVHDKFLKVAGGPKEGVIQAANKWLAPDGSVPLTAVETLRVYETTPNERLFDFDETLTAGEKDVTMGDSKDGSMALRLAETMRLKQPKTKPPGEGHLINSEGLKDDAVWGKHASWVDYSGPVGGQTLGVAFFENPQNPKHPTRWHARDYGLFAANPFCEHDMDKTQPEHSGDVVIKAGQSITLRYRFLLHEGDATQAKVADRYTEYLHAQP